MIAPKAEDVQRKAMIQKIDSWVGFYADWQIKLAVQYKQMIDSFEPEQVKEVNGQRVISYGLSSFGYDMRVSNEFKIFSASTGQLTVIDPKAIEEKALVDYVGGYCIIPPNSFALARSVEYFRMPRNVTGIVLGKSTMARCGIVANFTPLEAGWCGHVTIEISNTSSLPAKIYAGEGFAQVLFFGGEQPMISYADREGKYQNQVGIVLPKV